MANNVKRTVKIPVSLRIPAVHYTDGIDHPILTILDHPSDMAHNLGITSHQEGRGIPAQLTMSHCRTCGSKGLCATGDLRTVADTRCFYVLCRKCDRIYQKSGLKPYEYLMQFLADQDAEEIRIKAWRESQSQSQNQRRSQSRPEEYAEDFAPDLADSLQTSLDLFAKRLGVFLLCQILTIAVVFSPLRGVLRDGMAGVAFLIGLVLAFFLVPLLGKVEKAKEGLNG